MIYIAKFFFILSFNFNFLSNNPSSTKVTSSMYKVKSGIIHYKTTGSSLGSNKQLTVYFDDYGKKETVKIESDFLQIKQVIVLIKSGDIQYTILDTTQCIKAKRKKNFSLDNIDVDVLDERTKNEYGILRDNKQVVFLDKKCDKYIINNKAKNIKGELLVWLNIPLRITLQRNGVGEITEAYQLETETQMPVGIFDVPKNMEVLDETSINNY